MPRIQKSTAVYTSPFCAGYWRDAANELKSTKTLVIAALMVALRVATKGLAVPIAPGLRLFSVASFINILGSMIIGPVVAIPAAILSDFLGVMIWEGLGTYFFPYVFQEIGSSFIWALLLYRQKPSTWRVMVGRLSICVIVNLVMGISIDMLYQTVYYGQSTIVLTLPRVLKNTFMFPIETVAMTFFLGLLVPITNRFGLTYGGSDAKDNLAFGKKQILQLIALTVVGVLCVCAYLGYYYDNTSLSASYTTEERVEKNHQMQQIVLDRTDDYDDADALTVVESAYRPFLGKQTTYTVAVYLPIGDTGISDAMWAYKKSAAKGDEALTRVATATIVVEDASGSVVSCLVQPES